MKAMEQTETYCENCKEPLELTVPDIESSENRVDATCPKCGGRNFKNRPLGWEKPLSYNDKKFLRSIGVGSE